MVSITVIFFAIIAIFAGLYYIGTEYRAGTGFCSIAFGIILLVALGMGKFDKYTIEQSQEPEEAATVIEPIVEEEPVEETEPVEHVITEIVYDTIEHIQEVHDTIYLVELDQEVEDSIFVEIVSEIPLTEDEVDSIALVALDEE